MYISGSNFEHSSKPKAWSYDEKNLLGSTHEQLVFVAFLSAKFLANCVLVCTIDRQCCIIVAINLQVRVLDMYLVEGPKVLYRLALSGLKLFASLSQKLGNHNGQLVYLKYPLCPIYRVWVNNGCCSRSAMFYVVTAEGTLVSWSICHTSLELGIYSERMEISLKPCWWNWWKWSRFRFLGRNRWTGHIHTWSIQWIDPVSRAMVHPVELAARMGHMQGARVCVQSIPWWLQVNLVVGGYTNTPLFLFPFLVSALCIGSVRTFLA